MGVFDGIDIRCIDCIEGLKTVSPKSISLLLTDPPYGINEAEWDILSSNSNSALLGQSPAQVGKSGFSRRGVPINGWSKRDREISVWYGNWCKEWADLVFKTLKPGASAFVFCSRRTLHILIQSFETCGFILKDILSWEKAVAHHRAQRVSSVFERRGSFDLAKKWEGWRLGNLAPAWEPIAWFVVPYKIGGTVTDLVEEWGVGAFNAEVCKVNGKHPNNVLKFWFDKNEQRIHETQKPVKLFEYLINLVTVEGQKIIDPFLGSGTSAIASLNLGRQLIGFEVNPDFYEKAINRIDAERGDL